MFEIFFTDREKIVPGKMAPGKMVPEKMVPGKLVPGKMVYRKNGPRKNVLQKLSFVKTMLGNWNDFFIFINWFHYTNKKMFDVYITIRHMHETVEH